VPPGWEEFGYPQRRSDGTVMYFEIVGNLPGRQDAGRVWGDCYTSFMLDTCKFEQSIVDRRIFFRLGHGPTTRSGRRPILMVVGIHVDDNLIVSKDATASAEFNALWEAKFDSAPDSQLTQNDYLGIRLTRPSAGLMELQAPGLLQKLDAMIGAVFESRPPGTPAARPRGDVPINPDIFHQVAIGVSDANPVLGPETQTPARRVLGLAGFIVSQCRPDGYFAFVVLSQYIAHRFTKHVWRGILKLGCYLVETASIKLTYRAVTLRPATEDGDPDGTLPWAGFTDSSSQNGDRGGSYGGGCLAAETGPDESPSGIFMWLCMVPRRMTDSTMGAELTMAWAILKAIVSHRILSLELGILPAGPTRLHIDAQAVLDGADMEQVSRASRYLATRLAGYRDSVNAGVLLPCKTPGVDNVSDLFTKALIGKTFYRLRDLALGLRSLEDSDSDHGNKSYPTDTAVATATGPSANPSRAEGALEPVA
jgi:hypothetical protein